MDGQNIHRLTLNGKEVILIGTAHVSKKSAEEVKEIIESENPDSVCIELCEGRYETIQDKEKWKNTDIIKIIKSGKALMFFANILMSSYQKRLAKQFGIEAGQEMMQGIESAEKVGAELVLADRDIGTTFSRIWGNLGFRGKMKLFYSVILSLFDDEDITEDDLQELKSEDMLTSILKDLTESFPQLATPLVHERDQYLAEKIRMAPGNKVIAVLGAAHVPGIKKELFKSHDLGKLTEKPKKSNTGKIIGWGLAIAIIGIMVYTLIQNRAAGMSQILSWILWNGGLSAVGTALAFGHPLSILTAFVIAPISSLNPLLAAGWFAGLVEAYRRKPSVKDFEKLMDDVSSVKGIWKNNVTRILLVVIFANLGSTIGTLIGGADVIRVFLENFM